MLPVQREWPRTDTAINQDKRQFTCQLILKRDRKKKASASGLSLAEIERYRGCGDGQPIFFAS